MAIFAKSSQSISRRFNFAMIGVVTIIVTGFAIGLIAQKIKTSEAELQARLTVIAELAKMSLPAPLWYYNTEFLGDFLQALLLDETLICANILVEHKVVVEKIRPGSARQEWSFYEHSPEFITRVADIQYEGNTIGTLQLAASRANIRREIVVSIISTGTLALLLIFSLALTAMLITRRYIVRPLAQMAQIAATIANGELDERLAAMSHLQASQDELGLLARGFQRMIVYLQNMATVATQISLGDLDHEIRLRTPNDVLGHAFQRMMTYFQQVGQVAAQIAEGDLRHQVDVRSDKDRIGVAFANMTVGLTTLMTDIQAGSAALSAISAQVFQTASKNAAALGQIGQSAQETATAMQHVNGRSEEIRCAAESVNAAVGETGVFIQEMIASIAQVAENARQLSQFAEEATTTTGRMVHALETISAQAEQSKGLSESAVNDAQAGQASVKQVIASMTAIAAMTENIFTIISRLNEHALEINTILDVIYDVADQTSLLALNASILAAQAGVEGRGFAVVADEIKELAARVGVSTQEIAQIIKAVQRDSADAVEAIQQGQGEVQNGETVAQQAGVVLTKIGHSAGNSAQVAAEMAASVRQQTATHAGLAAAIRNVATMMSQITHAIQEQEQQTAGLSHVVENMQQLETHVLNATREQRENTHRVTELMEAVIFFVAEHHQGMQKFAAAANALAVQANTLKEHVERFHLPTPS